MNLLPALVFACLTFLGDAHRPDGRPEPELTATRHCVGVVVRAAEGPLLLSYRKRGEADWIDGHPLFLDERDGEARGSIVGLNPDTEYEVRLHRAAGAGTLGPFAVRTLADPPEAPGGGRTYHVSVDGSDDNPGTAADEPFRTLRRAAEAAGPGDTVLVGPGTYNETLKPSRAGEAGRYLTFRSTEDGAAVLDGRGLEHIVDLRGTGFVRVSGFRMESAGGSAVLVHGDADQVVIERNDIRDPGPGYFDSGVEIRSGCEAAVVRNNRITFSTGEFADARMGISLRNTDGGHLIYGNTIEGNGRIKDGIGGEPSFEAGGGPRQDTDINDNVITGCRDDGIEAEGGNVNVRVWGNRVDDCVVGIALAPTTRGPCYVWRNTITDAETAAFKLGEGARPGGHGALYLYHNTVHSPDTNATAFAGYGGDGFFDHVTARNNILCVGGYALEAKRAGEHNSFDHDLIWVTGGRRFAKWAGERIDLEDARAGPGFWKNGTVADPRLRRLGDGWVVPASDSPAVDAGKPLPGFNDAFRGTAPDSGAVETEAAK